MRITVRHGWILLTCILWLAVSSQAGAAGPRILALGNTGFLDPGSVQAATGAEVVQELGDERLQDFTVILLANVAFASLPTAVQQGLVEYVNGGGSLCLTGGSRAFGSGGYQPVAEILPFELRSASDWRAIHFRPPVVLHPGHPVLAGVEFGTIGAVNDLNVRRGSVELLRAAGGGSAGGGSYPYPLIAEVGIGSGRVLGIAFDLNEAGGMRDRDLFVRNVLTHLLAASRTGRGGS